MKQQFMRLIQLLGIVLLVAGLFAAVRPQPVAARDCDNNAVIRCGVGSIEELKQKYRANAGNTQGIFREFGITSEAQLNGMVMGRVTSSNQVYVGDKLVATNAMTAGRQNMPGSTPIAGGSAYKRPPSTSFRSGSLPAFVKMNGDTFAFAVILSCGNPVSARTAAPARAPTPPPPPPAPPKTPGIHVTKYVQVKGQGGWWNSVPTKPGTEVNFRVLVKNTGQVQLTNVIFRDVLPAGLSFVPGTIHVDGQRQGHLGLNRVNLGTFNVGQQKEVIFRARAGDNVEACGSKRLRNVASAKPDQTAEKSDDAFVEVCKTITPANQPQPQPEAPGKLPAAGPSGVATVFASTTILGVAFHRLREFYIKLLNR